MKRILICGPRDVAGSFTNLQRKPDAAELVFAYTPEEYRASFDSPGSISLVIAWLELLLENDFERTLETRKAHHEVPHVLMARQITLQTMRIVRILTANEVLQLPVERKILEAILTKYETDL